MPYGWGIESDKPLRPCIPTWICYDQAVRAAYGLTFAPGWQERSDSDRRVVQEHKRPVKSGDKFLVWLLVVCDPRWKHLTTTVHTAPKIGFLAQSHCDPMPAQSDPKLGYPTSETFSSAIAQNKQTVPDLVPTSAGFQAPPAASPFDESLLDPVLRESGPSDSMDERHSTMSVWDLITGERVPELEDDDQFADTDDIVPPKPITTAPDEILLDPAPTAPYEILLDLAPYEPSTSSILLAAAEQPSSVFV
jgi:hypothetical protein